jgi:hypothetical protein
MMPARKPTRSTVPAAIQKASGISTDTVSAEGAREVNADVSGPIIDRAKPKTSPSIKLIIIVILD